MLTVLHLAPKLRLGGPGLLAADLAEELELSGKACNAVMAPIGKGGARRPIGTVVPYVYYPGGSLALLQGGAVLRRFLNKSEVNIIVAYSEDAAWVAGRVCRAIPAPRRPKLVGALTAYPHKHLLGNGWQYCDAFTVISRHLRSEWAAFSPIFRKKTPWVIPYGMRETWCNPHYRSSQTWEDRWRERYGTEANRLSLCVPAPITPLHGHEDLVPLAATLRCNNISPRIYLVGDLNKADPHYMAHLKGLFNKGQLSQSTVWLGARTDLRDVLCSCDITLSLDKQPATYNRPVLEALCLGRPVAGYDHGVVGELLSTFMPEGRVAPGQVDALADTITQWSFYRPTAMESIPYPYRLADTVDNYMELFESLHS